MLITQGEVRKWLNSESFIRGVFFFCYGAGGVWVKCFFYYYCLVFLSVRLILSLICTKQTVIHAAFSETRDSLIAQKSIFNILSIIHILANAISIQSLKTPKIYAHMLIQFQDHVTKYSQTEEPPNTSQYTRPQKRNDVEQIGLITNIDIIAVMINFRFSSALCCLLRKAKMARPKQMLSF